MRRPLVAVLLASSAAVVVVAGPAQATMYGTHDVHGEIEKEYLALDGPQGFLGLPTTNEKAADDNVGRFNYFKGGAIYWTPSTGAHEVHSLIRSRWIKLGKYDGVLGYPVKDQTPTPKVAAQYSQFQNGIIYSSTAAGTHEVYGAILQAYASVGYENSALGLPTSGEKAVPDGGRRNNFQGGYIVWRADTGAEVHYR